MIKIKYIKISFIIFVLMLVPFLLTNKLSAYSVDPSSGSVGKGTTQTLNIIANPNGTDQNVVVIRLNVTGATVTNYSPPSADWTVINPDCTGGGFFTSNQVCVTLGKTNEIVAGEGLGNFSIVIPSSGEVSVSKTTGSVYSDGQTEDASLGNVAFFTISDSTTLPITSISSSSYMLFAGTGIIALGIILTMNSKHFNESKRTKS